MCFNISWLPNMISLHVTHMSQLEDFLWPYFYQDFIENLTYFIDYPIETNNPDDPDYARKIFYHITSKDNSRAESRSFDCERAKRLTWCKPIIEHSTDPNVLTWEYLEHSGKIRSYLYLRPNDLGYLIILQKNETKHTAMIISAYYVDQEWSRRQYLSKYNNRI